MVFPTTGRSALHRNNFNFLRLLLASLVIISHSFELIDGNAHRELLMRLFGTLSFGQVAVEGFFLLSGYLIVQSWLSQPQALSFLWRRVLRIYPGFIVCCLLCIFVTGPLGAKDVSLYLTNIHRIDVLNEVLLLDRPLLPKVFAGSHYPTVNGSLWTISYEFRCYLLVLVLGQLTLVRRRLFWLACTLGLTGAVLGEKYGWHLPRLPDWSPLNDTLFFFALYFFVGGCFYLYRQHLRFTPPRLLAATLLLGIGMCSPVLAELALALCGGYLLFWLAFTPLPALRRFQTLPDVSYGIYLYGWPMQKLLLWYIPSLSPLELLPLAWTAALLLALASWYGVEKPCLKLKDAMRGPVRVVDGVWRWVMCRVGLEG